MGSHLKRDSQAKLSLRKHIRARKSLQSLRSPAAQEAEGLGGPLNLPFLERGF